MRRLRRADGAAPQCDGALLGLHALASVPGDAATRAARIRAHEAFDPLWKGGELTRRQAYGWLAKAMGRSPIHIGELGAEDCERVVALCAERAGGDHG